MKTHETARGVLLQAGDRTVYFDSESIRLFVVAEDRTRGIEELESQIDSELGTESRTSDSLSLLRRDALFPILVGKESITHLRHRPRLGRLTINVSNACNLWCSYCYADHGMYHSPKSLMPAETGAEIIRRILEKYEMVETVQFFGGEPLMNLPAIQAIAQEFDDAVAQGRLTRLPRFVATTNGTICSDEVLATLKRWKIGLTVSWDGPREVHDLERPFNDRSSSSHDAILRSLERFTRNSIDYDVECTFNRSHVQAGIAVADLMRFFFEHTGKELVHIAPAFLPNSASGQTIFRGDLLPVYRASVPMEAIVESYREASRTTVVNFVRGQGPQLEFARRVIDQLLERRRSTQYCPAFFTQLSIAIDGSAFPCFMFIGDSKFRLGNILSDDFPTPQGIAVMERYQKEFGLNPTGTTRWYAPLASGCVAGEYISSGTLSSRSMDALQAAISEECVFGIATQYEQRIPAKLNAVFT